MRRAAVPGVLLLALLLTGGCGRTLKEQAASGSANYATGRAAFDRGDYFDAIADLKAYVEQYPGTDLTDDALFYLGQAYVRTKDYALASGQFDRLIRDFPATPHAADAVFWLARCDDLQSRPAMLDPTETERALQRYGEFLGQYPDSGHAAEARERVQALRDRLAEKRYRNGRLYYRLKQYPASEIYLRDVLVKYPQSSWAGEATLLLADVLLREGKREEAVDALKRLQASLPDGVLRARVADRLQSLGEPGTPR
jgi:outer membrane protein assembly factor BamD